MQGFSATERGAKTDWAWSVRWILWVMAVNGAGLWEKWQNSAGVRFRLSVMAV